MCPDQKDELSRYNPFDAATQEYEKKMNKKNAKKIIIEALLAVFIAVVSLCIFTLLGIGTEKAISISEGNFQFSGTPADLIAIVLSLGSWKEYKCWYSPGHPFTS